MHKRQQRSSRPSPKSGAQKVGTSAQSQPRTVTASRRLRHRRVVRSATTTAARTFSTTPKKFGSVHLIMGPMFSGKTTALLDVYRKSVAAGNQPLLIKHSSDIRYQGAAEVVSHTNSRESAVSSHLLADPRLTPLINERSHLFIDEGQFFPDLDVMVESFANNGKTVVVAALDGTFLREPFPGVAALIPRVEKLTKLNAKCHTCGDEAPFSRRISEDTAVHVIGGSDKYKAACRQHFFHPDAV